MLKNVFHFMRYFQNNLHELLNSELSLALLFVVSHQIPVVINTSSLK